MTQPIECGYPYPSMVHRPTIFKAFLAMILVALSGMTVAAAAHAVPAKFSASSEGNVVLQVVQSEAEPVQRFHITPESFECAECALECNTYAASLTSEPATETLALTNGEFSGDYELEDSCTFLGLEAFTDLNGCHYVFHAGTYTGGGSSTGTADLECPEGEAVESLFFPLFETQCRLKWPQQTGIGPITYTTSEGSEGSPSSVVVTAEVDNMAHEGFTGAVGACATNGLQFDGTYEATLTVTASEDIEGGEAVPLSIEEG